MLHRRCVEEGGRLHHRPRCGGQVCPCEQCWLWCGKCSWPSTPPTTTSTHICVRSQGTDETYKYRHSPALPTRLLLATPTSWRTASLLAGRLRELRYSTRRVLVFSSSLVLEVVLGSYQITRNGVPNPLRSLLIQRLPLQLYARLVTSDSASTFPRYHSGIIPAKHDAGPNSSKQSRRFFFFLRYF